MLIYAAEPTVHSRHSTIIFRDKYDVVAWIFSQYSYIPDPSGNCYYSLSALEKSLRAILEHRDFFRVAFASDGQNSLYEYIVQRDIAFNGEILRKAFHLQELDEEMLFMLKYHIHGCLGYVADWLSSDNPISPKELAGLEYKFMPEEMKTAWQQTPSGF